MSLILPSKYDVPSKLTLELFACICVQSVACVIGKRLHANGVVVMVSLTTHDLTAFFFKILTCYYNCHTNLAELIVSLVEERFDLEPV